MEEKKSKFSGLKKIFFTDEYLDINQEKKEEQIVVNKAPTNQIPITNFSNLNSESQVILDKIYNYLDSINSPEIDFIEVWDAMDEMGGVNETNLKATFAVMKVASKGKLTKELIINTGNEYLSKITDQINIDLNSKNSEISNFEAKKKDEASFLVNKKKEIEENIQKLQGELTQTNGFIKDLEFKYEPKIKEVQMKIAAGQTAISKITDEMNHIITLVNKTLS